MGKLPLVEILLKAGANPDLQDKEGNTAFTLSAAEVRSW